MIGVSSRDMSDEEEEIRGKGRIWKVLLLALLIIEKVQHSCTIEKEPVRNTRLARLSSSGLLGTILGLLATLATTS